MKLTIRGTCGAAKAPNRPHMEQIENMKCLVHVGNISVVYTYKTVYAIVTQHFPAKKHVSLYQK